MNCPSANKIYILDMRTNNVIENNVSVLFRGDGLNVYILYN